MPDVARSGSTAPRGAHPLRRVPHLVLVCTANISRSAYAQVRAFDFLPAGTALEVSGAGVHARYGDPMDPQMAARLATRSQRPPVTSSRPVTAELLESADLVLTMGVAHRTALLDDHPRSARTIVTIGQFQAALAGIDPTSTGFAAIDAALGARGSARVKDDVRDPYGRGGRAARICADQLDRYLGAIVPRIAVPVPADPVGPPAAAAPSADDGPRTGRTRR